jgi:uncharacterized membrane protein (DUF485 family)
MEILAIIFLIWLIGAAFPGSSDGNRFEPMMIVVFIVCAALLIAVGMGLLGASVVLASWAFGNPIYFGPILMALIASVMLVGAAFGQQPRTSGTDAEETK